LKSSLPKDQICDFAMSSFMTAEDARELEKTKSAVTKTAENGLILQIQAAIKHAIRHQIPFLLWNLPDFLTGAPSYDPDSMLDTLATHFKSNGFGCTADHKNLTLFVTWKSIRHVVPPNDDKKTTKRKEPEPEPTSSSSSSSNEPGVRRRNPEGNLNVKNSHNPHWTKMRFHDDDLF
jgi:hypothetical protein